MTTTKATVEISTSRTGKLAATTPGGLYVATVDTLDALPSLAASVRRCREVWDGERDSLTQVRAWLDLVDDHPLGALALRIAASEWGATADDPERDHVTTIALGERRVDVEITFPARRADGRPVVMDHAQGVATYVAATLGRLGAVEITSRVTGDRGTVIRGKASRAEMIAGLDHLAVVLGTQGRVIGVDGSTVRVEGVADYVETRW